MLRHSCPAGELLQNGRELKQILGELAQYFRSLMIVGVGGTVSAAEFCAEQEDVLREEAKRFTQEKIMTILRTLNETMQELRFSPQPRIAVETMFIALCRAADAPARRLQNRPRHRTVRTRCVLRGSRHR